MFPELHKRARKAGQPPGTPTYTGKKKQTKPQVNIFTYNATDFHESSGNELDLSALSKDTDKITWVNVEGLQDTAIIEKLAEHYQIHPLTVEDILNVQQRPKIEEFENYHFITLKMLIWRPTTHRFHTEQCSIVFGKNFVLSFQDHDTEIFNTILNRMRSSPSQRLRQQGSDYLAYRLLDVIVDYYFVVLEGVGEELEKVEERVVATPKPEVTRTIYRLKRQVMVLRKLIWPLREVLSHLLQLDDKFISPFTRIYMRDLYDHIVQAIDSVEVFRDMLSSMLDMYLSSLTNRTNEIMKTLTIIATIFIPITFISSFYGMNFVYMPELHWRYGYYIVTAVMAAVAIAMLVYFRRKKWI